MKQNQEVTHSEYGRATVVSLIKATPECTEGVQLKLTTDKGIAKYASDRDGVLPYLYESDYSKLN